MATAASLSAPLSFPAGERAPSSRFWPLAGLTLAGTAVGVGLGVLIHRASRPKVLSTGTPPRQPGELPQQSAVLEAIDDPSLQAIIARPEPMIVLLYCGQTGQGALRAKFEQLAQATPQITFAAVASGAMPADTPDLQEICAAYEGVLFLKRKTNERLELLDGEDQGFLRIGGAQGVPADAALASGLAWISDASAGPIPTTVSYLVDVWTETNVEPPLVAVPVGTQVDLPLLVPDPAAPVQLTNVKGDPVTGPQGPTWDPEGQTVRFYAAVPGTTVFTAIQGDWRRQAFVRALA